ncbi:lysophospholipid acyltransferase family protein [Eudoraea chungangensis]|uniref:lysophospholipid acyltransferase family protein n=1 Tax=Eudoraea chungangensis TaxID=1481905 RepID=UPI0023EB7876|nr:lysophospholipid acyltransferase family protein [Eudoraea chungangensis]
MRLLFNKLGHIIYRIWFYILVSVPIFLFFPLLIITSISEKTYPQFFWLARNIWANTILYGMLCFPKIKYEEKIARDKSYMLVANHTSMLDIMMMLKVSKHPFVFVGKKELVKIPVFGFFYKRVCIMVDREDSRSRTGVYRRAHKRLSKGLSICIFPEGGVPEENIVLDKFKDGAFKMALNQKIPIVPIVFYDNKKRFPFTFFNGHPGITRAKVMPFVNTINLEETDLARLNNGVRTSIYQELIKSM